MKNNKYLKEIYRKLNRCIKNYKNDEWYNVDRVLYNLCKTFSTHKSINEILTKVVAVDRIYRAWLYRKRVNYYEVAKRLQELNLDSMLEKVGKNLTEKNIKNVTEIVLLVANPVNPQRPRYIVFASKYLHFHKPSLIPIFDSNVKKEMKKISKRLHLHSECRCRTEYECFCHQILELKKALQKIAKKRISFSELDKLLYGKRYLLRG
jgi:hypothetical protein